MKTEPEKCCATCAHFDHEDTYGIGWCDLMQEETSCDLECEDYKP